jgi:hypothetical protein
VFDGAFASLSRFRPVLVLETGHEADGDRQVIHDLLGGLGYRMLGLLLDFRDDRGQLAGLCRSRLAVPSR